MISIGLRKMRTFVKVLRSQGLSGASALLRWKFTGTPPASFVAQTAVVPPGSPAEIVDSRFPALRRMRTYTPPVSKRRLTIVTDSIGKSSLFGGVATAIIMGAIIARDDRRSLRIITRTERADPRAVSMILKHNGINANIDVEFLFYPSDRMRPMEVSKNEIFITTSWWTTQCVINSVSPDRIIYLLQEDERGFYPLGDDYIRAEAVMARRDLRFVINTPLLKRHLIQTGLANLNDASCAFEPAFDSTSFYREPKEQKRRRLGFYARPNNPRNLFYLGLEILDEVTKSGIINGETWEIVLFGKDVPPITFEGNCEVVIADSLPWNEYAALIRSIDVGLSLMATPHPSYPPLDMAASGCIVVTNAFGIKDDLSSYSGNIVVASLDKSSLVDALRSACQRISAPNNDIDPPVPSGLMTSWEDALNPVSLFCRKVDA